MAMIIDFISYCLLCILFFYFFIAFKAVNVKCLTTGVSITSKDPREPNPFIPSPLPTC